MGGAWVASAQAPNMLNAHALCIAFIHSDLLAKTENQNRNGVLGHSNKMLCFWLSGFFNSDAGGRVITIIIIMVGVACETKSRRSQGLQLEEFSIPSTLVFSNILPVVYTRVASYLVRTYI